jgi:hypothetical protein
LASSGCHYHLVDWVVWNSLSALQQARARFKLEQSFAIILQSTFDFCSRFQQRREAAKTQQALSRLGMV